MSKRPIAGGMEALIQHPISVLDSGFVRLVDYMGNDDAIVQAARVSYGEGTRTPSDDRNLIRYLMKHRHTTPFEMCEIKLHMKLPIFVARQLIRHRTASVNEYSARYSILGRQFYTPAPEHIAEQSNTNKQGRDMTVTPEQAKWVQQLLTSDAIDCYNTYQTLLNDPEQPGHVHDNPQLARELARIGLNLSYYTEWYWKIDLHNLFHFLKLRMDSHAQYEIRAYANVIGDIVHDWVPLAWEAFEDYVREAHTFSKQQLAALHEIVEGRRGIINDAPPNLTEREWKEIWTVLEGES